MINLSNLIESKQQFLSSASWWFGQGFPNRNGATKKPVCLLIDRRKSRDRGKLDLGKISLRVDYKQLIVLNRLGALMMLDFWNHIHLKTGVLNFQFGGEMRLPNFTGI
jgi:hypothetical protein